jgi:hypothetical protein
MHYSCAVLRGIKTMQFANPPEIHPAGQGFMKVLNLVVKRLRTVQHGTVERMSKYVSEYHARTKTGVLVLSPIVLTA